MSLSPERISPGCGTRTIAFVALIIVLILAAGFLFFSLQQTQTDLEDTRRTATQSANSGAQAATEAAGTAVANINALQFAGTEYIESCL